MSVAISAASEKGKRPYQEDSFVVHETPEGWLLAVFDGHGGGEASERCVTIVSEVFDTVRKTVLVANLENIIREVFHVLNTEVEDFIAGTTASLVFIPENGKEAVVGILGDSPVFIQKRDGNLWLSPEHNVRTNDDERHAVQERGGFVSGDGYLFAFNSRCGLQLSRALGDREFSKVLNREPEIFRIPLSDDSFVLVASDGLFDPSHASCPSREIGKEIGDGADAAALVERAVKKPTHDNATAILVQFSKDL